ncbi:hypothetical protein TRFO_15316 [Tritrichomonas foetus]|uniref:DOCKER domain-containing protein n=1 Tax=Tritrichomonas foetus TaxID=1144522 RepID=A0A1J4KXU7_9EUKA|nr:hypothetical protein TRFO_15316 [Tritrichomonas foetus]|eukprot:OHT14381.1 hypothetical protein TRFO_15316 [Tritrichomonas foetus]
MNIDQQVLEDIHLATIENHYDWLEPIINTEKNIQNPYLDDSKSADNDYFAFDPDFKENPIGGIFVRPLNTIDFTFTDFTAQKNESDPRGSKHIELSQFVTPRRSSLDLNSPNMIFQLSSSMVFDVPKKIAAPPISGFLKCFPIKLSKVDCEFEFVGPIMLSAFLYSIQTKSIISETWNFFPNQSLNFLKSYSVDYNNQQKATFEIDTLKNYTLFIFLSHPVTEERGSIVKDYYFDPTPENARTAKTVLNQTKTDKNIHFQTFAFTFFDFNHVRLAEEPLMGPSCYLIEKIPAEKQISQLIFDANARRLKQIHFKVWMMKDEEISPVIIHQTAQFRPQPYISPVHECTLRIDNLTIPENVANSNDLSNLGYIVQVALKDGQIPIVQVHSTFDPVKLVSTGETKICSPAASFNFNENFFLDLPYPLKPSHLVTFRILRIYLDAKGEINTEEIGTESQLLINDDGLIIGDSIKTLTIAESYKLTVKFFIRSNAYLSDKTLYNFLTSENPSLETLSSIPPALLTTHLHSILLKMLNNLENNNDQNFVKVFVEMSNSITSIIYSKKYSKFLIAFVRFFAFPTKGDDLSSLLISPSHFDVNDLNDPNESSNSNGNEGTSSFGEKEKGEKNFSEYQFHLKILKLLTTYLTNVRDSIDQLAPYFDFLFSLIAKFLAVDQNISIFGDDFQVFVIAYAYSSMQSENISKLVRSFGLFITLLYDTGYPTAAVEAIHIMLANWTEKESLVPAKLDFLDSVFKPSLFAMLLRNSKLFKDLVIDLLRIGYENIAVSPEPGRLFDIILRLTEIYDVKMNESIATNLIEAAAFFKPQLFLSNDALLSPLIFFLFLLINSNIVPSDCKVFDGLHYLLKKVSTKEVLNQNLNSVKFKTRESPAPLICDDTKSTNKIKLRAGTISPRKKAAEAPLASRIIKAVDLLKDQKEERRAKLFTRYIYESVFELIDKFEKLDQLPLQNIILLIFHLISVTTSSDLLNKLVSVLTSLLKKYKMEFIKVESPAVVRILAKLYQICQKNDTMNASIAIFIDSLFCIDFACNNNNNRMNAIFMRSLSTLNNSNIVDINIHSLFTQLETMTANESLSKCISNYQQIRNLSIRLNVDALTPSEISELLFAKFRLFDKSPDAQIVILESLYELHVAENDLFEAACTSVIQGAIIFENLTVWRRMPNYFRLAHPCCIFRDICSICTTVQCTDEYMKDPPLIPGFCDSSTFNEQGFISLMYRIFQLCEKNRILDIAAMLIDLCWPIFEYWHSFNELKVMFDFFQRLFSGIVDDTEGQDAFTDRYFRVTFFGEKLKDQDGKMYIYRAKPLTHLFDFTTRILSQYEQIYGKENVIQISTSEKVDTSELNLKEKVYIQITFVEPYHNEMNEGSRNAHQFYYETPFLKDEKSNKKAAQGSVDKQWIRRTILSIDIDLPSLLVRAEVDPQKIIEKEYEPIKVAYRQLRDRTGMLEKAFSTHDLMKTQQLLHGSLLVQVNEGPARIADVFLSNNISTAAEKLRESFICFMRQVRKGVGIHAQYSSQNPEFMPLQEELEAGYETLKNKLAPMCAKPVGTP